MADGEGDERRERLTRMFTDRNPDVRIRSVSSGLPHVVRMKAVSAEGSRYVTIFDRPAAIQASAFLVKRAYVKAAWNEILSLEIRGRSRLPEISWVIPEILEDMAECLLLREPTDQNGFRALDERGGPFQSVWVRRIFRNLLNVPDGSVPAEMLVPSNVYVDGKGDVRLSCSILVASRLFGSEKVHAVQAARLAAALLLDEHHGKPEFDPQKLDALRNRDPRFVGTLQSLTTEGCDSTCASARALLGRESQAESALMIRGTTGRLAGPRRVDIAGIVVLVLFILALLVWMRFFK